MLRAASCAALVGAVLVCAPVEGAEPEHSGTYMRLALGPSYIHAGYHGQVAPCVLCGYDAPRSATLTGPTFTPEAAIGGGYRGVIFAFRVGVIMPFAWSMELEEEDSTDPIEPAPFAIVMPGFLLDWYPDAEAGFHMFFSPSMAVANVADAEERIESSWDSVGPVATFGVGYEWWTSPVGSIGMQARIDMGWLSHEAVEAPNPNEARALSFVAPGLQLVMTLNGEERQP